MGIAAPCFVARRQRCNQHRFLLAPRLGLASSMCAAHAITRTHSLAARFEWARGTSLDAQRLRRLVVVLRPDPDDHAEAAAGPAGSVGGVDVDAGVGEPLEDLGGGAGAIVALDEKSALLVAQPQGEALDGLG